MPDVAEAPVFETIPLAPFGVEVKADLSHPLSPRKKAALVHLVDRHAIQSAGWFKSRKVAAVGFGAHPPRTLELAPGQAPSRRVEIFVFTPQT